MPWCGVALRGSILHLRRRDVLLPQPQFIFRQRESRDEKVDRLKVSEKLGMVEKPSPITKLDVFSKVSLRGRLIVAAINVV